MKNRVKLKVNKSYALFLLLFFVYCLLSTELFADDWPVFRANSQRTGMSLEILQAPFTLKWSKNFGTQFYSSPVKYQDQIYIGGKDGKLYCLNAFSGEVLWYYQTQDAIYSTPQVTEDAVYFTSRDGKLYVLNKDTGALIWQLTDGGDNLSSPVVSDGIVYYGSGYPNKNIYALDAKTGTFVWQYRAENHIYSSLAVYGNKVVFGDTEGNLYIVNAGDGTLLSKFKTSGVFYFTSFAISSGVAYFVASDYDKNLYALNLSDATVKWKVEMGTETNDSLVKVSSPAVASGIIFVCAGYPEQKLYAVDVNSGSKIWYKNLFDASNYNYTSSPAVASSLVFVGSAQGSLYIYDTTSGDLKDKIDLDGPIISSPAVSNGMVYVATTSGTISSYYGQDEVKPTVFINDPTEGSLQPGGEISITGTVSDENLEKYIVEYGEGDAPANYIKIQESNLGVNSGNLGILNTEGLSDGKYTVRVTAYDVAGNSASAKVVFDLDNTPPPLSITSPSDNYCTNQKEVVVEGVTETDATVTIDGGEATVDREGKFNKTVTLTTEGENNIEVKAVDVAGNENKVVLTITLDITPPPITITSPEDNLLTNRSPILVEGTTEVNAKLKIAQEEVEVSSEGSFSKEVPLSNEGENKIEIVAEDLAGNLTQVTRTVFLDTIPSSLQVTQPADGYITNQQKVEVKGKAEVGSSVGLRLNQSDEISLTLQSDGTFSYELTLNEGSNQVEVTASDAAGNISKVSLTILLDTIPPTGSLKIQNGDKFTNKLDIKIEILATDNEGGSGVEKVLVANDKEFSQYSPLLEGCPEGTGCLITIEDWQLKEGDGEKTVYVRIYDKAGNYLSIEDRIILDTKTYYKEKIDITKEVSAKTGDGTTLIIPANSIKLKSGAPSSDLYLVISNPKKEDQEYPDIPKVFTELRATDILREIKIIQEAGEEAIIEFSQEIILSIPYSGAKYSKEKNLRIYVYNEEKNTWEIASLKQQVLDGKVTAKISHLSVFRIFELIAEEGKIIYQTVPYPNPFNPHTEDINISYKLHPSANIKEIRLEIYSLSGKLIWEKKIYTGEEQAIPGKLKKIVWDGRNKYGEIVANGVYFYRIVAIDFNGEREVLKGKIAVLK